MVGMLEILFQVNIDGSVVTIIVTGYPEQIFNYQF